MCLHTPYVEGVSARQADAARPQARKSSFKPLFKFTVLRAHACAPKGLPGPPMRSPTPQNCKDAHLAHIRVMRNRSDSGAATWLASWAQKPKSPRIETTLRNLQVFVESTACCLSRRLRGLH